jgi:hypothetical protein
MIVLGAMVFHAVFELQLYFPRLRSETMTTVTQVGMTFAIQWDYRRSFSSLVQAPGCR